MPVRVLWYAALVGVSVLALAACKGTKSSGGSNSIPTLAGTPLPTATVQAPTSEVCAPPESLALPPNFPPELKVAIPPDMTVFSIQTEPFLQVVGHAPPQIDPNRNEPPFGIAAFAVVQQMQALGWTAKLNQKADGADWTFTSPDGRVLHFNALPKPRCSGVIQLTYDLQWISPD